MTIESGSIHLNPNIDLWIAQGGEAQAAGTLSVPAMPVADYSFVIAALCVVFYAYHRFNSPALLRSTTTAGQYWTALFGYVIASTGLYAGLAWALRVNPEVATLFSLIAAGSVPKQYATLPAPFIAALMLTVFLPKVPILKGFDSGVQDFFRTLGAIPHQAIHLAWKLQRTALRPPADREAEVKQRIADRDLDPRIFLEAPADTTEGRWAKIVALKVAIEDYTGAHPGFGTLQPEQIEHIDDLYARQADMATVIYRGSRRDATLMRTFRRDCRVLLKKMSEVIAPGMFHTQRNMRSVLTELAHWGFEGLDAAQPRLSFNQIAGIVFGVAAYLLVFFLIFGSGSMQSLDRTLKMVVCIALIIGASIACATLPKAMFLRLTSAGHAGQRHFLFYAAASAAAGAAWFAVHTLRLTIEGQDFAAIREILFTQRPWIVMAIVTAFATAWLTEDEPGRGRLPAQFQSWLEGAIMALALATAMLLVQYWFSQIRQTPFVLAEVTRFLGGAAGIGFLIGYFVPGLSRQIPEDLRRLQEEEETLRQVMHDEPEEAEQRTGPIARRWARMIPMPGWPRPLSTAALTLGAFGILVSGWEATRNFAGKVREIPPVP